MLEVGRIVKPHGLRGEVIVELFTNRKERVAPGTELSVPGGSLIVKRSVAHQHRWIVAFDGVSDRDGAEALRDIVLSAEPIEDPDALWVHELVGMEVRTVDGEKLDEVASILANPAGDIIETKTGILIPLRFVVEHGKDFVRVDPPEGLIEVNQ